MMTTMTPISPVAVVGVYKTTILDKLAHGGQGQIFLIERKQAQRNRIERNSATTDATTKTTGGTR